MKYIIINPFASPYAGAPALKYGDVNTVTPSPGEVKGLIQEFFLPQEILMKNKHEINIKTKIFKVKLNRISIFI